MTGSTVNILRVCGVFALLGAVLLAVGIAWLYMDAGSTSWTSTLPGISGMFLATGSLLLIYPLLTREGVGGGAMSAALGVAVVTVSLVALLFVVLVATSGGISRIVATAWVVVFWIRPVGILLFAFALVRADILFGRALLLFLVAFTETPILSNILAPGGESGASVLLFGRTDFQTGLVSAALWAGFGYSMILLSRRESRRESRTTSPLVKP